MGHLRDKEDSQMEEQPLNTTLPQVPTVMDAVTKLLNRQRLEEKRGLYNQLSRQHHARTRLLAGLSLKRQIQEIESKARQTRLR